MGRVAEPKPLKSVAQCPKLDRPEITPIAPAERAKDVPMEEDVQRSVAQVYVAPQRRNRAVTQEDSARIR